MSGPRFWGIIILIFIVAVGGIVLGWRYLSLKERNIEIQEKVAENLHYVDSMKVEFQKLQLEADRFREQKQEQKRVREKYETNYKKRDIEYQNTDFSTDTSELYKFLKGFNE